MVAIFVLTNGATDGTILNRTIISPQKSLGVFGIGSYVGIGLSKIDTGVSRSASGD